MRCGLTGIAMRLPTGIVLLTSLLAALGAWFGWQAIPATILLASVVGAAVGISLMVFARHGRDIPIPFGPYLAGAGGLTLFFSKPLMALYGLA